MKKTITTLALALSLCAASYAQGQPMGQSMAKPSPDAKLIFKTTDGDMMVCRWRVMDKNEDGGTDFTVHYQMNLTQLVSTYSENSARLKSLHTFLDELANDDCKQITQIDVMGYASPDGPSVLNQRLSTSRAVDFRAYIDKHYDLADVAGVTRGIALPWSATVEMVEESNIPQQNMVLDLVTSSHSQPDIQAALSKMAPSWDYMCQNILPELRYVEMHVKYNSWSEVVTRTPMNVTQVRERCEEPATSYYVIEEDPSDIIVFDNPYAPLDFPDAGRDKLKIKGDGEKYKARMNNRYYRSKYNSR